MLRRIRKLIARLSCKKDNTVSQQAFQVYCDYVALAAAVRNEQFWKETQPLEAADRTLLNVQLKKNFNVLKEFNIIKEGPIFTVEGDRMVYAFDDIDAFPHEEFRSLNVTISGVTVPTRFPSPLSLTVTEDGTVEMEIKFSDMISVFGILENFSGTTEQVKDMIRCNHAALYFGSLIGEVDAATGQPVVHVATYTNYLEGSTFLVKSIKVAVEAVQPTMNSASECTARVGIAVELAKTEENGDTRNWYRYLVRLDETEEDDLQNLSKASMNHYGLRNVAALRKAWTEVDHFYKFCRNTLNCIEMNWKESRLKLCLEDDGRRGLNPFTSSPAWFFERPEGFATIPLSSLRDIGITLAGIHWNESKTNLNEQLLEENTLMLEFSPAIIAILVPDESWIELDVENIDIDGYIRHKLTPRDSNIISNYQGPEPELTMRLMLLSIKLSNIKNLLDALGVDHTSVEDE